MPEELRGGFGLEPAFDLLVGQRADAERQLSFGDAGLRDIQRLDDHVPGRQTGSGTSSSRRSPNP